MRGCQDCSAVLADREMRHDDTCPAGRAGDQCYLDDVAWFAAHPGAEFRYRKPCPSETQSAQAVGAVGPEEAVTRVRVDPVARGVHTRAFFCGSRMVTLSAYIPKAA